MEDSADLPDLSPLSISEEDISEAQSSESQSTSFSDEDSADLPDLSPLSIREEDISEAKSSSESQSTSFSDEDVRGSDYSDAILQEKVRSDSSSSYSSGGTQRVKRQRKTPEKLKDYEIWRPRINNTDSVSSNSSGIVTFKHNRQETNEHYSWSQEDTIKISSSVASSESLFSATELPKNEEIHEVFFKNLNSELSDSERSEDLPQIFVPESDEIPSDPVSVENETDRSKQSSQSLINSNSDYTSPHSDRISSPELSETTHNIDKDTSSILSSEPECKSDILNDKPADVQYNTDDEQGAEDLQFDITVSHEDWTKIKPLWKGEKAQRCLQKGWVECLSTKLPSASTEGCIFIYKYNRVKCPSSRKKNAPFFRGKGKCSRRDCTRTIEIIKVEEPNDGDSNVSFAVSINGRPLHHSPGRTPLKGRARVDMAEVARCDGVSNTYYNNINKADPQELSQGNFSAVPSMSVLRKAVSELVKKEMMDNDFIQEVVMLKEVYENDDPEPQMRYSGYVQYIGIDPFTLFLFMRQQFTYFEKNRQPNLYVDATGTLIKTLKNQKKPFLYSVVVKPNDDLPPMSIADMITTDHSQPSITHFLLFFKRAVKETVGTFTPKKIEIDWSWPLINSVLMAFNTMTVKRYLSFAWDFVHHKHREDSIKHFTVIHICCAHMTKTFACHAKKIAKRNKELYQFLMRSFVVLCNATSLQQTKNHLCCMMTVLLSPNVTRDVLRSVESIKQASSRCQQSTENESDDASFASDDVHSETIDNSHITIAQHSPWTALANEIKNQHLKAHGQDEGKPSSRYFSPDSVEMIIKKFIHIYPLWSGLLLGSLSRYSEEKEEESPSGNLQTRDSNANVESWFGTVKHDIFKGKERMRPGLFITKLKKNINGRLKEQSFPALRQPKRKSTDLEMLSEKWSKKKKRKENHYQPRKFTSFIQSSSSEDFEEESSKCEAYETRSKVKSQKRKQTTTESKMSQGQHKSNCPRKKSQRSKTEKATEMKDEMRKREEGSKKTKDIGLLLSVPKWGGKSSIGHQLWNTCTIDNFLTIMHVTSIENPEWQEKLIDETKTFGTLLTCLHLMARGSFDDAKAAWMTAIDPTALGYKKVDLFGEEHEMYSNHINQWFRILIKQRCSNPECPAPYKEKMETGIFLRSNLGTSMSLKELFKQWFRPPSTVCGQGLGQSGATSSHSMRRCSGAITIKREVVTCPPIIAVMVSDLVRGHCHSADVKDFSPMVEFKDATQKTVTYTLVGITLHRRGHFIACIKSKENGWYYYDGLDGFLLKYRKELVRDSIPQHAIYVQHL